jgi:YfiH family protein
MNKIIEDIGWNVSASVKIMVTKKNFLSDNNFNLSCKNNNYNKVKKNINLLSKNYLPSKPIILKQVHGKKIIDLTKDRIISNIGDGLITKNRNQVLSILTADCIPLVISSICGNLICILHVGRKGAEFNIVKAAFKTLKKYNYKYEAWFGPSISKEHYLVDKEIKNDFVSIDSKYEEFFIKIKTSYKMDLIGIVSHQLRQNYINNIFYSNLCTYENYRSFFSYRKSLDTRRFATFVWRE